MSFSFIHTGDLHLDSPLTGLGALEDERAAEVATASRRAFDELVDIAVARRVDAMLIAGDLWDGEWSDVGVGLHVQEQAARLARAGIRTFAVLGNHDALSRVTDRIRDLDTIHLFPADRPGSVECGPAVIHGMSYGRPDTTDNVALAYPEAVPGRINIGLLHTALDGSYGHSPYAPCSLRDLSRKRYHYWALGHVHTRQRLQQAPAGEGGTVAFCGVLQGRHVRETGVKGAFHGVVDGDSVRLSEIDFHHVAWFVAEADVSGGNVKEAIREALARVADEAGPSLRLAVVRLTLTGCTQRHHALATRRREILDEARFMASRLGEGRLLVEDVRLATTPPADAAPAPLPHRFDAMLARAAADPQVRDRAAREVMDILAALPAEARAHVAEALPALEAFEESGDPATLLSDAAATVAARLSGETAD